MKKSYEHKEAQKREQDEEQKEQHSNDKYSLILEEPGKTPADVNYELVNLLGINIDTAMEMTKYTPYLILDDLKLEEAEGYKNKLESVGATISIELDKGNSSRDYL